MIRIIKSSKDRLIIRQYPANKWLAFIFLAFLSVLFFYHSFFQSPISSSLICYKGFLGTTNCELIESALLNQDLTHKYIKNIKEPHKHFSSRNNVIWLKTEIKVWHGRIKNVYYPSSWFLDPFLYRTDKQVLSEVEKLNNFIHNRSNLQKLTITRKVPAVFSIIVWILLLPMSLPLVFLFILPVYTYCFDLQTNRLSITETILFTPNKEIFSLEGLKILLKMDNNESSIVLETTSEKTYTLNDFVTEREAPHIFALLKQLIPSITKTK